MLINQMHYVSNGEGWELALKCVSDPNTFDPEKKPIAIIPGYAMNSHIFGFHPTGLSMEAYFANAGFEVWSLDLRAQGKARNLRQTFFRTSNTNYGLKERAVNDLSYALDYIVSKTQSLHEKVDVIGASLGGTLVYMHAVLVSDNHLGTLVSLGSPLRWDDVHPLIRFVFASPRLVGMVPIRHTRWMAQIAYPLLMHFPSLMKIYLHEDIVDTSQMKEMIPTVDDPNPRLNRQIANWIANKDLVVDGLNITRGMQFVKNPLLCILANADGIVLPKTAASGCAAIGSSAKKVLEVGTDHLRFAHADLFVSNYSHEMVFQPIVDWFQEHLTT